MTRPFVLITLTGPAGSGKDTVADLLCTHCGFHKMAFAEPLRHEIGEAFGIEPVYLSRRETKEHPMSALALRKCRADGFVGRMIIAFGEQDIKLDLDAPRSPRQIMQWWGTDYRRHQAADYWTRQTGARINYLFNQGLAHRIVITDCRFTNEAELVRDTHGGLLWQLSRPGCDVPEGSHISEVSGADFNPDAVIDNSLDIRHLQQRVLGEFWAHDAGLAGVTVRIAA